VPVLHGVSIEVAAGEMLAIVGPNGAGKSTLLKVLGGIDQAQRGSVELFGRPLDSIDRRRVRAHPSRPSARKTRSAFRFTVLEIVLMGRAPASWRLPFREPARFGDRISRARAFRPARSLCPPTSRNSLAASASECSSRGALAQEPKVRWLDEPTAFLDLKHVAEIFRALSRAMQRARDGRGRERFTISTPPRSTRSRVADRWTALRIACGLPPKF